MNEEEFTGKCPHCGKRFTFEKKAGEKYGSPLKTCSKCGKKFADTRYQEIAISGVSPDVFNIRRLLILIGISAAITLLCGSIHLSEVTHGDGYYPIFGLLTLLMPFLVLYAIIDIIVIKTGVKQRHYQKLTQQSIERMKNPAYVRDLASLGYSIPERYREKTEV